MLPFCISFRFLNGNKLQAIPDRAFLNLKNLEYMYVSHIAYFLSFSFKYNHAHTAACNKHCNCHECYHEYTVGGAGYIVIFSQDLFQNE